MKWLAMGSSLDPEGDGKPLKVVDLEGMITTLLIIPLVAAWQMD